MNPVMVVRHTQRSAPNSPRVLDPDNPDHWVPDGRRCWLWCPGCNSAHAIAVEGEDGTRPGTCWEWDGNVETPTFSPSYLVHQTTVSPLCHSFIRAGQWEFLSDCSHELAGQTVDLVPLPDWLVP